MKVAARNVRINQTVRRHREHPRLDTTVYDRVHVIGVKVHPTVPRNVLITWSDGKTAPYFEGEEFLVDDPMTLREKIAAVAAADADLADVCLKNAKAGIREETDEWNDANDRSYDASMYVPWYARWYADFRSMRINRAAWEAVWNAEDAAECRGDNHDR